MAPSKADSNDKRVVLVAFTVAVIQLASCLPRGQSETLVFDVVKYGASGDGATDDNAAFRGAWKALCSSAGSTAFLIPAGKTFLLSPISFAGSCQCSSIDFSVSGNIIAPEEGSGKWNGCPDAWIEFLGINKLTITGSGTIDGQGSSWWNLKTDGGSCSKPTGIHFHDCNNLGVYGVHIKDSPRNHVSINVCSDVVLSNLKITAPGSSPNTDGIDISRSTRVVIQDSYIGTGDDCVAINGGSKFINITKVTCGPGHGISVGSLGRDKNEDDVVEEVRVMNCTMTGTSNGARIKTVPGGTGYARKIFFEGIYMDNVKNPIIIDQYYGVSKKFLSKTSSDIAISDVTYSNIRGTSASQVAITLNCSESRGCSNVIMDHISIGKAESGDEAIAHCKNVHGSATLTKPEVPCLS